GDDILAQHQVFDIAHRDDDALPPGKPGYAAGVKKALDLLVDTADRLDSAELIDRAGQREVLTDRHFGKRRQQGEKCGSIRAVSVDPPIGLLEDKTGVERQGRGAAKTARRESR